MQVGIPAKHHRLPNRVFRNDLDNDPITTDFSDFDIIGGDGAVYDDQDYLLKSWIAPNYAPDAVLVQ